MGHWAFKQLFAFASELAVGQILCLFGYDNIFFFSRLSRRVGGTGWKALYANDCINSITEYFVCVMCLTATGWFVY
jgi:hypothetical protein